MGPRTPSSPAAAALAYGLQITLATLVLASPGASGPGGFWNYGLGILLIPLGLRWLCRRPVAPRHRVWISGALGLHALGAIYGFYHIAWYDHLTHLVSASLVVAAGYAVGIVLLRVSSTRLPRHVLHAGTLLLIVVCGLTWEVYELYVPHLTVYGVEDTVKDVIFDLLGWVVLVPTYRTLLGRFPDHLTARAVVYTGHARAVPE